MELGFTSLLAVEFRNRLIKIIGREYRKEMTATLLFDYPTIGPLADFILRKILSLKEIDTSYEDTKSSDYDSEDDLLKDLEKNKRELDHE